MMPTFLKSWDALNGQMHFNVKEGEFGVKSVKKPIRTILSSTIVALMAVGVAEAGSFSLYTESSAVALGNFAAGVAAEASDASTGWYNPAGLALIHNQQVVMSGAGVFPSSKMSGTSTYSSPLPTPPFPAGSRTSNVESFSDVNGSKKDAFVPAFHYAHPLGDNATFGFSMVSPFGLTTNWETYGPVRYSATKSELLTFNAAPELGAKITENFALGAGLDLQYAKVKFNSVIGSPALLQFAGLAPTLYDSAVTNQGHSFGIGFHAGAMFMLNENHTRLGLNYQSRMNHKFNGDSSLNGRLAQGASPASSPDAYFWSDHLSSDNVTLPEVVTLSGYHDINEQLALLGSVVYTGWSSLPTIPLNNVAAFNSTLNRQVLVNSSSTLDYRNAWRASAGANYKINTAWMLRLGGGYDQTPVTDEHRDVRIPDEDKWALSAGAHYQARPNMGFDIGYTHLCTVRDPQINNTQALSTSTYNVNATAKARVDLVGIQMTWLMDDFTPPVAMTK